MRISGNSGDEDVDLLSPSLRAEDDAGGFDHPWNPNTIVLLSLFVGGIAGGSLLAFNFTRLGLRSRFWPTLIGFFILTLITYIVLLPYWPTVTAADAGSTRSILRFIRRGIVVLATWLVSRPQMKRYRLAIMTDSPRGKLFWPGVLATVIGVAVEAVIAISVAMVMVRG